MHRTLACAAVAAIFFGLSLSASPSAMQAPGRAAVGPLVQPVDCVGDRRSDRHVKHCRQVNPRRLAYLNM